MLAMADIQATRGVDASGIVTTTVSTQGLPATPSPSPYHPLMYEGYASEHRTTEPWTAAVVTSEAGTMDGTVTAVTASGY